MVCRSYTWQHKPPPLAPLSCFRERVGEWGENGEWYFSLSCSQTPHGQCQTVTIGVVCGGAYGGLLIQMQRISLRSSGLRRKQNLEKILGLKVTQLSCLFFTFSPPLFFRFSSLLFFFFCCAFCWLYCVRKSFWGKLLGEKKGRGSWNEIFFGICGSTLHGFLTESYSFWYGLKDLFILHELADKVVLDR